MADSPRQKPRQKRLKDFNLGRQIGHGAFGEVLEVEDKETHIKYAMKILSKAHILREKKMKYVTVERDVLTKLHHPNIIRLLLTFQDPGNLYFVTELAERGDIQKVLDVHYSIDIDITKMLLGQLLLAISHIHKNRILHRDIKPENILIDSQNRVKVTDFGTAKIFDSNESFKYDRGSFVGSADYVSPEIMLETPVGPSSDIWSFGCVAYAMIVGEAPFHANSNFATFQKIEKNQYTFPDFVPADAKDLIEKILVPDPNLRLGNNEYESDYESIRNHPFFNGIDWRKLPIEPVPDFRPFEPAVAARDLENEENNISILKEDEGELVIREGHVTFLSPSGKSKSLCLILTDLPRILMTDLNKTVIKIEIDLSTEIKLEMVSPTQLKLNGLDIIVEEEEADKWIEIINQVICEL
ncbi:AGC family protein kinase [Tritrichomonas foetus]|uniref:non-specific serine/threonine protein kinase n=1 Tax=Tritrichomonas foetus TaxID=1144522 RepID=A0A1J4JQN3_9EUKA|nr:AGC family protein kinase [Tritrichomonas foetus]|eukprot:OHT01066.1 AGC family protein kinase [Tritrichomonas foetus]